ncbi:hypothetical protein R3P38DRAFT_3423684, partial [Favolaschia claudopus]
MTFRLRVERDDQDGAKEALDDTKVVKTATKQCSKSLNSEGDSKFSIFLPMQFDQVSRLRRKALQQKFREFDRNKTGQRFHLTAGDVIGAMQRGDEEIAIIIRMKCIAYDHGFADDIAPRVRAGNS